MAEIRYASAMAAVLACVCAFTAAATENRTPGQIHDYPGTETATSRNPHNLSFEYPNDGLARAEFRSDEFYAIILKSAERCTLSEADRLGIQELFPENKVFMDRFECDEASEDNVTYTNINPDYSFIAVYAGTGIEDANQLLDGMDLAARFPGANIRRMQAVLVYP